MSARLHRRTAGLGRIDEWPGIPDPAGSRRHARTLQCTLPRFLCPRRTSNIWPMSLLTLSACISKTEFRWPCRQATRPRGVGDRPHSSISFERSNFSSGQFGVPEPRIFFLHWRPSTSEILLSDRLTSACRRGATLRPSLGPLLHPAVTRQGFRLAAFCQCAR